MVGSIGGSSGGSKGISMSLIDVLKNAWADPDLRARIIFVASMFAVFTLGVHIPVPITGMAPSQVEAIIARNPLFALADTFGGGALGRLSIFSLGLNPYITSSIIMQILTQAFPEWKKEIQEGGEHARKKQNQRTRALTLALCVAQSLGYISMFTQSGINVTPVDKFSIIAFWTAGAMFVLWLGEQISEKGIGNGVSLMIFCGITISLPKTIETLTRSTAANAMSIFQLIVLIIVFVATTFFIVHFTLAQRKIPIQMMRRQMGTKVLGGQTTFLPIPVNMAGVIPIIFASSLAFIPSQLASMFPQTSAPHQFFATLTNWLYPGSTMPQGLVGTIVFAFLIFFFTYFYTAIQYNVEDIANNLKRQGAFIQGVRPGKQTKEFLDKIVSRITIAGAFFLTVIAVSQTWIPTLTGAASSSLVRGLGGTSLLIIVSVALETLKQMEANILMKRYGN
jgi:preprotein translocase subunit SecY